MVSLHNMTEKNNCYNYRRNGIAFLLLLVYYSKKEKQKEIYMSQKYRKQKYIIAEKKKKQKKIILITSLAVVAAVAIAFLLWFTISNANKVAEENYPVAKMNIEGYGEVEIVLYPNEAPNTVRNFIELANSGFYDGQIISRVCEGFCIQMGSPDGTTAGDAGYSIKGEFANNGFTKNTIKHEAGVISMARSSDYDSAGSQFFICTGTKSALQHLDGNYAAFGKVISGYDIIEEISKVANDDSMSAGGGKPLIDVVVTSITVDTKGINYKSADKIK